MIPPPWSPVTLYPGKSCDGDSILPGCGKERAEASRQDEEHGGKEGGIHRKSREKIVILRKRGVRDSKPQYQDLQTRMAELCAQREGKGFKQGGNIIRLPARVLILCRKWNEGRQEMNWQFPLIPKELLA